MELKRPKNGQINRILPLLIVPYGIETHVVFINVMCSCLLIVPYGIETNRPYYIDGQVEYTFNRTLWN